MTINAFLYPLAIGAVLTLAACGDAPDDAITTQTNLDGSTTMQIQVPEAAVPAAEAIANPGQAIENLQQGAADMSEEAKVQAVRGARAAAEEASRLIGQTPAQIEQAGDDAERRAREAMGMPAL